MEIVIIFLLVYVLCFIMGAYQWLQDFGRITIVSLIFLIFVGWIVGFCIFVEENTRKSYNKLRKFDIVIYRKKD